MSQEQSKQITQKYGSLKDMDDGVRHSGLWGERSLHEARLARRRRAILIPPNLVSEPGTPGIGLVDTLTDETTDLAFKSVKPPEVASITTDQLLVDINSLLGNAAVAAVQS